MNIVIDYARGGLDENFKVIAIDLKLYTDHKVLYHACLDAQTSGHIAFDIQVPRDKMVFDISCHDPDIFHCPMIITGIHFDDFYHLTSIVHHAMPIPASSNTHIVELVPGNCLFFCGTLQYRWDVPIAQIAMPGPGRWADPK